MKQKYYKDTIHGFKALCRNKITAWMLIRNKCKELSLKVPPINKIEEVK